MYKSFFTAFTRDHHCNLSSAVSQVHTLKSNISNIFKYIRPRFSYRTKSYLPILEPKFHTLFFTSAKYDGLF